MKIIRFASMFTAAFLFSMNAYGQVTPKTDNFLGKGGISTKIDTVKFAQTGTLLEKNDPFLEFEIQYLRTGVLLNDLKFKTGWTNPLDSSSHIPAGTLFYATNFGQSYGASTYRSAGGLAWCAIDLEMKKPVCIFWNGHNESILYKHKGPIVRAAYVKGDKSQSPYYVSSFRLDNIESGTIPEIEEKPVDFGRKLLVRVHFKKFKKGEARIYATFTDGEKTVNYWDTQVGPAEIKLNENNEATFTLMGQKIKLIQHDPKEKKLATFELVQ